MNGELAAMLDLEAAVEANQQHDRPAPDFSQIDVIQAVLIGIRECLGLDLLNQRQLDACIRSANVIYAELAKPHAAAKPGMGLKAWLECDDTGISSREMARHLAPAAGLKHGVSCGSDWRHDDRYPQDPADFVRCVGLLGAVPELRPHLAEMRDVSPVWADYVDAWPELEALLAEELPTGNCPKLYERMRQITCPHQAAKILKGGAQ